uniref:Transcription factor TGA3 n=1 Tax=Noccaea caerulescens TaxID=107243 RepID=A0A1J3F3H5_NOCCA
MEMMSSSSSTQVVSFREMYEPFQQLSGWENAFSNITSNQNNNQSSSTILEVDARAEADGNNNKANHTSLYNSVEAEPSSNNDQDEDQINDKMKRRLAQNREAARKSRLRKKAHVQQLEESRLKLSQLEQELVRARQQGLCVRNSSDSSYLGPAGTVNTGIAAFEMEHTHWLEEQNKRVSEIRTALQAHVSDIELKMLVDICLSHYANLFRMKADAAKADVFFLISGMWRTSTERFFQWIGGFRPSELLNVVMPYIEPLTDQQILEVRNLQQSSQQAEEALSQGLDKLQQSLVESISTQIKVVDSVNFGAQMGSAMENLQALEGFANQADHLRQQSLQQMSKILTTRQAARGLLALGEYFHRLRALSSLWAARPREHT